MLKRQPDRRIVRALILVGVISSFHFGTMFSLGVLAFIAQGSLTSPDAPARLYGWVPGVAEILEFPLVWAIRRNDPERLSGFMLAAACNSLLWGTILYGVGVVVARLRSVR